MSDSKWIEIDDRTVCIMDKDLYFAIEENVSSLKARITQLEAQLAEPRNKCNCNCPSCSYCDNKLGGWTMSDEWSGFQTNLISITAKKMLRKMRFIAVTYIRRHFDGSGPTLLFAHAQRHLVMDSLIAP